MHAVEHPCEILRVLGRDEIHEAVADIDSGREIARHVQKIEGTLETVLMDYSKYHTLGILVRDVSHHKSSAVLLLQAIEQLLTRRGGRRGGGAGVINLVIGIHDFDICIQL